MYMQVLLIQMECFP